MIRFLSLAAFFAALTLLADTALGQEQEPAPTAQPDQIVIAGKVPAPPGTTVWVQYAVLPNWPKGPPKTAVCGTSTTTPTPSGDPEISRFVLVFDAACAAKAFFGPTICWGENLCRGAIEDLKDFVGGPPRGGDTVETGLLPAHDPNPTATVPAGFVHGDRGPEIALPPAGGGESLDQTARYAWLLWAGLALLASGLTVGAITVAVRWRS